MHPQYTTTARANHSPAMRLILPIALLALCGTISQAATLCVNQTTGSTCKSTIGAAVAAAAPGDTIQVYPGTYKEEVVIEKTLSLVAQNLKNPPTIDATGRSNGILISGVSAAPGAGVNDVMVFGFNVRYANFEGILVQNATQATLATNHVYLNNKALDVAGGTCPGIPAFETNESSDCGEGIHLMAVSQSSVVNNEVDGNSGGILTSDETGASKQNVISNNWVHDNGYACGITLASHPPATTVISSATLPFGINHNTISNNLSEHNGTLLPGAGAGVGIYAAFPGTANSANVVIGNTLRNNGLPGFAMHNHKASAEAPPIDLTDNRIIGNHFSGNAADTGDAATSGPTGINIYSEAPVYGLLIVQNTFDNEAIDVAYNSPTGEIQVHLNDFATTGVGVENLGSGIIFAEGNWWNCAAGPGNAGCTTATGTNVTFAPWLPTSF